MGLIALGTGIPTLTTSAPFGGKAAPSHQQENQESIPVWNGIQLVFPILLLKDIWVSSLRTVLESSREGRKTRNYFVTMSSQVLINNNYQ